MSRRARHASNRIRELTAQLAIEHTIVEAGLEDRTMRPYGVNVAPQQILGLRTRDLDRLPSDRFLDLLGTKGAWPLARSQALHQPSVMEGLFF